MKTPSTTLFTLIQSMTAAEKRLFKLQHQSNNETEPKILNLFDIISALDVYDENLVKEQLNDASFSKNLKVHKNRLYQSLLYFLAKNTLPSKMVKEIKLNIAVIEVFLQRKMYKQAHEMIQKTKKLCLEYEEYELLLYVQSIESRQLVYFREKNDTMDEVIADMRKNLDIIDNYLSYAQLNHQLLQMKFRQDERLRDLYQLEEYMKSKYLFKNGELIAPKSDIAKRLRFHCKSIIYSLQGEYELAAECTKNVVLIMENNHTLIKERPNVYFSALFNHMCSCAMLEDWDEFDIYHKKQMILVEKNSILEPYLIYTYTLLLENYRNKGECQAAYELYKAKVYTPDGDYNKYQDYPIDYFLAQMLEVLLQLNKKEELYDLLNTLQKDIGNQTPYITIAIWIVQISVYIQYEEYNLLSCWLEALRKRLQRNKIKHALLNKIIAFAQKLITKPQEQHAKLYKAHLAKIDELIAGKDNKIIALKSIFNYDKWLKHQAK